MNFRNFQCSSNNFQRLRIFVYLFFFSNLLKKLLFMKVIRIVPRALQNTADSVNSFNRSTLKSNDIFLNEWPKTRISKAVLNNKYSIRKFTMTICKTAKIFWDYVRAVSASINNEICSFLQVKNRMTNSFLENLHFINLSVKLTCKKQLEALAGIQMITLLIPRVWMDCINFQFS